MASSATITAVIKEPLPSTRILINFSDGNQLEFASLLDMQNAVSELDTRVDTTRFLFIGWWLARNPDASNSNLVVNKTMTFDLTTPSILKVQ